MGQVPSSAGRSRFWCWAANLLVPGAGLILCRREWLGVAVATVFGLCGQVALAGWFIAPAAIPTWLTVGVSILTGGAWIIGQHLLRQRIREWDRDLAAVAPLLSEAAAHVADGRLEAAATVIDAAMRVDDDNAEARLLREHLVAARNRRAEKPPSEAR